LSIRDNLKTRRLIQSPWYQERWSHMFALAGDQNAKQRFENDKTGYRLATSVGGTATGEGGSRLLLDDPHSAQAAQSDVIRNSDLEWFDMVWSTRLNNPKEDAMVTIMQRLHEKDISGHIIDDIGGWEHICIPAEWDGVKRSTVLGNYDPRQKVGELICPDRFGDKEIDNLKKLLGQYGSAGQLQQNPSPADGGILKTKYFEMWPADKGLPPFEYILQSYDCAFTEKSTGDPTACTVWAIFTHNGERNVMLIDAWEDHLSYPDLRKRAIKDWGTEYGGMTKDSPYSRARRPDRILVEAKASGQSLIQDLRLAKVPVIGYNPGNADKISRAHQASPTLELGLIWIPESGKNKGHFVSWAQGFIKQLEKFPVAEHDDYVDTFSQAIIYLKNDGWFELPRAKDIDEPRIKPKEYVNPYAI
jgi:predicted phage terminase large subunit-like protein